MPSFIEVLSQLRERRKVLQDAIAKTQSSVEALDRVIAALEAAAQDLSEEQLQALALPFLSLSTSAQQTRQRSRGELPPAEIAETVRRLLLETGRPLKRGEIVTQLLARGVPLAGRDKNKNVGTILWRHSNQFVHLENLGYWPKDAAIPGVYTPPESD